MLDEFDISLLGSHKSSGSKKALTQQCKMGPRGIQPDPVCWQAMNYACRILIDIDRYTLWRECCISARLLQQAAVRRVCFVSQLNSFHLTTSLRPSLPRLRHPTSSRLPLLFTTNRFSHMSGTSRASTRRVFSNAKVKQAQK